METVYLSPKELTPYINNPKLHDDEQIEKIIRSINLTGFDQPIVVNKEGNKLVVVKGHGRLKAALKMKLDKVPVIILELPKEVADKARLIDNKAAEGDYDIEKLLSELNKFNNDSEELLDTGYNEIEYAKLMQTLQDELEMDDDSDASGNRNREIDVDGFEFDHTCPKCNFSFND